LELLTIRELLRHRQSDTPCDECFNLHYRLVAYLFKWKGITHSDDGKNKSSISIRVSCEETLAGKRECPVMGQKGYEILLTMEGAALFPFAAVRSLE